MYVVYKYLPPLTCSHESNQVCRCIPRGQYHGNAEKKNEVPVIHVSQILRYVQLANGALFILLKNGGSKQLLNKLSCYY